MSDFDDEAFPIIFNQGINQTPKGSPGNPINNRITIQLPQQRSFEDCEVAMQNLFVYYSWYNISAAFGNNIMSYLWGNTCYAFVLPDGIYQITDLNNYLHDAMSPIHQYDIKAVPGFAFNT